MLIRVKIQGVKESDKIKFKKIFNLSVNRKLQYSLVEQDADVIINADPRYKPDGSIPVLTVGKVENFPESTAHIKPPLLGIRVLKALDAIQAESSVKIVSEKLVEEKKPDIAKPESENENVALTQAGSTYRVLIVDDSVLIHKALELELQSAKFGTDSTYAESGEQCLECIKEAKFDMIFLDIMMPGIDGFETCTQIRKNPLYKKTPVIMLSSKTSPLDEVKGVMAGCTTYLTKPIKHKDFQKLLIRMDKWLENYNPTK